MRVSFAPDGSPPTPPASPRRALDSSRIALTWGGSTDNVGVTGYRVLRGGALVTTVTGTSFTDTGLAPATPYTYQVIAVDAGGNTSPAATAARRH